MSFQQYTVTLSHLGAYTLKVVASSPESAKAIAIEAFYDALTPTPDMSIVARTTEANAVLDDPQPSRQFKVIVSDIHDMQAHIPAESPETAIMHTKRIIAAGGPLLEFEISDCRLGEVEVVR